MGVVSRWVWVESMGVVSGCGCKEVYIFPHNCERSELSGLFPIALIFYNLYTV